MCFGGDCGASIDIQILGGSRLDFALFNETAGTFVVEVANDELAHALFGTVPHLILGKTTEEKTIRVHDGENEVFTADLYEIKHAWQQPLKEVLA
jgi:phosphoribosylformylglycinamidine (FGAM) synthase-like enzyme